MRAPCFIASARRPGLPRSVRAGSAESHPHALRSDALRSGITAIMRPHSASPWEVDVWRLASLHSKHLEVPGTEAASAALGSLIASVANTTWLGHGRSGPAAGDQALGRLDLEPARLPSGQLRCRRRLVLGIGPGRTGRGTRAAAGALHPFWVSRGPQCPGLLLASVLCGLGPAEQPQLSTSCWRAYRSGCHRTVAVARPVFSGGYSWRAPRQYWPGDAQLFFRARLDRNAGRARAVVRSVDSGFEYGACSPASLRLQAAGCKRT